MALLMTPFCLDQHLALLHFANMTEENANGEKCPARRFCFHSCLAHECEILRCWKKNHVDGLGKNIFVF